MLCEGRVSAPVLIRSLSVYLAERIRSQGGGVEGGVESERTIERSVEEYASERAVALGSGTESAGALTGTSEVTVVDLIERLGRIEDGVIRRIKGSID